MSNDAIYQKCRELMYVYGPDQIKEMIKEGVFSDVFAGFLSQLVSKEDG